jgi:hypothetical protein
MRTVLIIASLLAALATPAAAQKIITLVPPGTPSQPQQQVSPQQQLSPTAAACAAEALGKVTQGAQVLASSVGFLESHTMSPSGDVLAFYAVVIKLRLGGQEFSYRYMCKSLAGNIQIINRSLIQ